MNTLPDLNKLEQNAFASVTLDETFELVCGIMLMNSLLAPRFLEYGFSTPLNFVPGMLAAMVVLYSVKFFITKPRAGIVKFSEKRKIEMRKLAMISVFFVLITLLTVIQTRYHIIKWGIKINSFLVPLIISIIFVFLPLSFIAYFHNSERLLFVSALATLAFPFGAFLRSNLGKEYFFTGFAIIGFLIFSIGIHTLHRFMQQHPLVLDEGEQ